MSRGAATALRRVAVGVVGVAACWLLPEPWRWAGFVLLVSQLVALLGVGRIPVPDGTPPSDGAAVDVVLLEAGPRVLETVRVLRRYSGWTAQDAKELLGHLPTPLGLRLSSENADALVQELAEVAALAGVVPPSIRHADSGG